MSIEAREAFITRTADLIAAGVTSSVIVAGLQGLLGGLAFAVLGLSAPVFWGVVMGLACLLPFGAASSGCRLQSSWPTGSMTRGLVLIGLGAGVVGLVDNIVRPLLLSGRVQMNGLVILRQPAGRPQCVRAARHHSRSAGGGDGDLAGHRVRRNLGAAELA